MEATRLASSSELEDIGQRMQKKSALFQAVLQPDSIADLSEKKLKTLFKYMFFLRRKSAILLQSNTMESIRNEITTLLYGEQDLAVRYNRFVSTISGLNEMLSVSLASELLFFTNPEKYWLMNNWIWDPKTKGGALSLILQNDYEVKGETSGELYKSIGEAMHMVNQAGQVEGFSRISSGLYGTHIFLACVYAVYMFTVFKIKLSKEFNRILPQLPELARRVLGVQKLEI
ncbi:MAG: hypothetical protein D8M58_16895 [Calditrichaeota bacterium]|nr:MAG: hypothetical protein DWQ03_12025 [Calditrichota bacterium]MBL1207085.1 hypothetical protein [Calditrichota bacterium]